MIDPNNLLKALRKLDTAAICDADKTLLAQNDPASTTGGTYPGIKLMNGNLRLINDHYKDKETNHNATIAGFARTVQCAQRNDFLAVLRGLMDAQKDEVLVVDTCNSDLAVAGELFSLTATQVGMQGLVIDGPVRDTVFVQDMHDIKVFATSITPYSGTIQSPGKIQVPVNCGGILVEPGEVVVGDRDGIVVASPEMFGALLPQAQKIHQLEAKIKERLLEGTTLESMTNAKEHIEARLAGKPSSLEFKV